MATNAVLADAATDRGVYDALEALRSLLIDGEQLEACAIQRRLFALRHRRIMVAATTGRLIVVHRSLFGGFNPIDVRWQDLRDASVHVGTFAATLRVAVYRSSDLASTEGPPSNLIVAGLRKLEAQEVYRACQARAQAWREKRRIRELEEMRAKAGGIQIGAGGQMSGLGVPRPAMAGPDDGDSSPMARLQRAKDMLQSGLLNDAESSRSRPKFLPSYDDSDPYHSRAPHRFHHGGSSPDRAARCVRAPRCANAGLRNAGGVPLAVCRTGEHGGTHYGRRRRPQESKDVLCHRRHGWRLEDVECRHDVRPTLGWQHADRLGWRHRNRAE